MRTRALVALVFLLPACGQDSPIGNTASGPSSNGGSSGSTSSAGGGSTPTGPLTISTDGPADKTATLDYFFGMQTGAAQFKAFCSYGNKDKFTAAYCAGATPPSITSLNDLLGLVGMAGQFGGGNKNVAFAINSQNASLVSRSTSVLNPRAILYDSATPFVAFGFARGDNVVEIAADDPNSGDINFFLVHYQHACDAGATCTTGDNFTSQNENNWVSVDIYTGHQDLVNTPRQCDTCHRPQGFNFTSNTGSTSILRMQELVNPWTHWFRSNRGGSGLVATFCQAHTEAYATIPNADICGNGAPQGNGGDPANMQRNLIQAHNFDKNPNVITYQGNQINNDSNAFVGPPNATWLGFFSRTLTGDLIHVPHFEINPFDDSKVNAAVPTYKAVEAGTMPMNAMPDLHADSFLQPSALPILGHQALVTDPATNQAATATQVVYQMCSTCHQGVFPGSGNRELFQVSQFPNGLTADEKLRVANRICRDSQSVYLMPPAMFADLDDNAKALILTALGFASTCPQMPAMPSP